jgi:hypothetical protein
MNFLLFHAVDRAAALYPDHEAVRFAGQSMSYAELAQRAAMGWPACCWKMACSAATGWAFT